MRAGMTFVFIELMFNFFREIVLTLLKAETVGEAGQKSLGNSVDRTPPGFGLRQSSGALACARARGEGTIKPSSHAPRWKSGRGLPQSKTLRDSRRRGESSARFWSAPVLWRFLHTTARTPPACTSFARQETISPSAHKNHRPYARRVTCSARASARRALAPRCRRRATAGPPGLRPVPAATPAPAGVQPARARRGRCHLPPRLRPIGHPG